MDFVAVHERRPPSAARREPLRDHPDHRIEVTSGDRAIGPRPAHEREQVLLGAIAGRRLGHDLLREHIERRVVFDDGVEVAIEAGADERGALDEIVARDGEQPPLRRADDRVARPADALQERRDAVRRADLAHEVDVADVDAELERCRGNQCLEAARLEPMLRVEPCLLREASMVRRDRPFAEALRQLARQALRQPPRIHEYQRRPMRPINSVSRS